MKRIVLLCANGMSTSLLAFKMNAFSKEKSLSYNIEAHPIDDVKEFADVSCILLGPQVHFQLTKVKKIVRCPTDIIDTTHYGNMNGEKVILQVATLLEDKKTIALLS